MLTIHAQYRAEIRKFRPVYLDKLAKIAEAHKSGSIAVKLDNTRFGIIRNGCIITVFRRRQNQIANAQNLRVDYILEG